MTDAATVIDRDHLTDPEAGPAVFRHAPGEGVGFVVDLGEEMYGYPLLDIECPAGVTVDLATASCSRWPRERPCRPIRGSPMTAVTALPTTENGSTRTTCADGVSRSNVMGDRYVTRAGRQRFEIFDTKGCRYLELHFRNIPKEPQSPFTKSASPEVAPTSPARASSPAPTSC